MENPNNVKRSIRIPRELNDVLKQLSDELGISVNQIILQVLRERLK